MEIIKSEPRKLEHLIEPNQKLHLITKYLQGKELHYKEDENVVISIIKTNSDASQIVAMSHSIFQYLPEQEFAFYAFLTRYVEIDLKVIKTNPDGSILFFVKDVIIAKDGRSEPRIRNNGIMHVSHITTVKAIIEANMFQIPTLVKVTFDEFKSKLLPPRFENVKMDIFKASLPRRFSVVKKTLKPLLITDTQKKESFLTKDPELLSYDTDIDEEIESEIKNFQEDMIVSEAIVPILYSKENEPPFAMGYILVQNKERHLTKEDIIYLKGLASDIVKRIHESNTMTLHDKFKVLDASPTGIRIEIDNEDLIKILPKQKSILFDIYFKMQPPLRVMGDIRWIARKSPDKIQVGLKLEAKSDNPGERVRYLHNLENLKKELEQEKIQAN